MCFVNIYIQYSLTKYGFLSASEIIKAFSDFHFLSLPSLSPSPFATSCLEQVYETSRPLFHQILDPPLKLFTNMYGVMKCT